MIIRGLLIGNRVGVLEAGYLFGFTVIGKIQSSWRQKYFSQLWQTGERASPGKCRIHIVDTVC
jgi:hypothetical protein